MLLSTAYLPPISYFNKLQFADILIIEMYEHFVKQTIRNRCHIYSPNGIQTLIIPVQHNNRNRTNLNDIRISNALPWQRQHWRSLCSAYQRSAFFEFYQDELAPFYEREYEFLLDFNMDLMRFLMPILNVKCKIQYTEKYLAPGAQLNDFRFLSDAGVPLADAGISSYPQVFGYKFGFQSGLSVVDLIFNMGPAAGTYFRTA
ncbi:MAG: WbqC family protein [Bacteroidetes bacterium]|nr:WbqC family protein [Bacteroidota bacterium]